MFLRSPLFYTLLSNSCRTLSVEDESVDVDSFLVLACLGWLFEVSVQPSAVAELQHVQLFYSRPQTFQALSFLSTWRVRNHLKLPLLCHFQGIRYITSVARLLSTYTSVLGFLSDQFGIQRAAICLLSIPEWDLNASASNWALCFLLYSFTCLLHAQLGYVPCWQSLLLVFTQEPVG